MSTIKLHQLENPAAHAKKNANASSSSSWLQGKGSIYQRTELPTAIPTSSLLVPNSVVLQVEPNAEERNEAMEDDESLDYSSQFNDFEALVDVNFELPSNNGPFSPDFDNINANMFDVDSDSDSFMDNIFSAELLDESPDFTFGSGYTEEIGATMKMQHEIEQSKLKFSEKRKIADENAYGCDNITTDSKVFLRSDTENIDIPVATKILFDEYGFQNEIPFATVCQQSRNSQECNISSIPVAAEVVPVKAWNNSILAFQHGYLQERKNLSVPEISFPYLNPTKSFHSVPLNSAPITVPQIDFPNLNPTKGFYSVPLYGAPMFQLKGCTSNQCIQLQPVVNQEHRQGLQPWQQINKPQHIYMPMKASPNPPTHVALKEKLKSARVLATAKRERVNGKFKKRERTFVFA